MAASQAVNGNVMPVFETPVEAWYTTHQNEYDLVEERLSSINQKFLESDRNTQTQMLRYSYTFAVMSIQTRVEDHEKAFVEYVNGADIYEAVRGTNFGGDEAKGAWIRKTFSDPAHFTDVINLLENGKVDDAHKYMIDEWTGVSSVKAAFVLAMLGFTQKMCLDVNMMNLFNLEDRKTVVVERYDSWCQEIVDMHPEIDVDPFILQWVCFDYQRGVHSTHEVFFEALEDV